MIKATHRVAIYLRVSTLDQTTANQERELREVASRSGWEVIKVYRDRRASSMGASLHDTPPALRFLAAILWLHSGGLVAFAP